MKKLLLNKWGLKLASLVLAFALWFLVVQIEDPTDTKTFTNIKVRLTNTELLKEENKVYEVLDNTDTVRVTVRAPRSIIDALSASDIVAEADVSKLTDINTVAISYSVLNTDTDYNIEGNHDVVRLNVEEKASKYVSLISNVKGTVAEGFVVGGVSMDQNMIEISGPKSAVEKVGYASVDINVNGASNSLSANVDIQLYDTEGSLVSQDNIVKQADYAHIEVEVLAAKSIPIKVNYSGEPEEGYMLTGEVECAPENIKVAGTVGALSTVSEIVIPADRLNLDAAMEDVVEIVNIKEYLPENVRLVDASAGNIKITIHVEPIVKKTLNIPSTRVSIINVPDGMEAELSDESVSYSLTVEGLRRHVNTMKADNINLIVDIAGWMEEREQTSVKPGSYPISAQVNLSNDVSITAPVVVSVVIANEDE